MTPEVLRRMERMILLHVIDTKWKEHLHSMDQVKDGISLRALGQRDPLVEYKKEEEQKGDRLLDKVDAKT